MATLRIFDGTSYKPVSSTKLGDDADNIRWDGVEREIYVSYGSGALAAVDEKGTKVGEILLDAHAERGVLESGGRTGEAGTLAPRLQSGAPT